MFKNTIPTFQEVCKEDHEDWLLRRRSPYSKCYASFYNTEYAVTLALWRNDYGRCYEVGLVDLQTDDFEINYQSNLRLCYRRFCRLAKLIEGNRKPKIRKY